MSSADNSNSDSSSPWAMELFSRHVGNVTEQIQTSNVFAPFEEVQLYANVSYGNAPVSNLGVSFEVRGPLNSSRPTILIRSARTDTNGTATITFRIPMNNQTENMILGTWQVFSAAATATEPIQGNLTFEVKYHVEINKISFLNAEGDEQNRFSKDNIRVQLTLKNIDLQSRAVNVTADLKDSSHASIGQIKIQNENLKNDTNTQVEQEFEIPTEAALGEATVECNVYSGGYGETEIQVAETKTATFTIINRDVAVTAAYLSTDKLYAGNPLNVTMKVANKGNDTETLHILISNDLGSIGNLTTALAPLTDEDLTYDWDTLDAAAGTYTITVQIAKLPGEIELGNNEITAGTVTIDYPPIYPQTTSLFVLLLTITGIFTISLLLMFLRKQRNLAQKPISGAPKLKASNRSQYTKETIGIETANSRRRKSLKTKPHAH
jgi:hypothetical protein